MKATSLNFFYFDEEWTIPATDLARRLDGHRLVPCGAFDMEKHGFVEVDKEGHMALQIGGFILVNLAIESRVLPSSVIARLVEEKADQYRRQTGIDPGRVTLRKFKDEAVTELMPRSFTRTSVITGFIDRSRRRFCVLTGSRSQAERFVVSLRSVVEEAAIVPPASSFIPSRLMAEWVASGAAPDDIEIGMDCGMEARVGEGRIRYINEDLSDAQVRENANTGFDVSSLGLTWKDRVDFVLTKGLGLKKIRFLETLPSEVAEDTGPDTWYSDALHVCGELSGLLDSLETALAVNPPVQSTKPAVRAEEFDYER